MAESNFHKVVLVEKFGAPEVLQLKEVKISTPGPKEVLVKVYAVGINPVETYLRAGTYRRLPELPYVPGRDASGVIESVGAEVSHLKVGQRVFCDSMTKGAYSQYFCVPAEDVLPLGEILSFAQGAAVGVGYRTAYRALFEKAKIESGHWVLIRGASGGVGQACIEMACLHGAKVIGTSSTEKGREVILKKGAKHALNHSGDNFNQEIMKLTEGNGVDVVVEMLANKNLDADLQILAQGGCVVIVGNRGRIEINPRDLMMKETRILGMLGGPRNDSEKRRYRNYLIAQIHSGRFQPTVGYQFDFEDAPKAHEEVISHSKGTLGKIILCPFGLEAAASTN